MSDFELKIKTQNVDIEIRGSYLEVLSVYEKIREDFLKLNSKNRESLGDQQKESLGENTEPTMLKPIKTKKRVSETNSIKTNTSKKGSKLQLTQLAEQFDEKKFYEEIAKLGPKKNKDQILVAMSLYKEMTQCNDFSLDLIHTLLNKAAIDTPKNLRVMLSNFVNGDKILERSQTGFSIKFAGEKAISDIKKKLSEPTA